MEDCHVHILSLPDDPGTAFFAVYDGHGGNRIEFVCFELPLRYSRKYSWFSTLSGAKVAQYASKHLHEYITRRPEYKAGNIVEAMQQGFLELDRTMQYDTILRDEQAGTTVIALLIKDNVLYSVSRG